MGDGVRLVAEHQKISVGRDALIPPQRDIIKLYHLPTLRPTPRDDASIVPYKSLFLFAAKFYLSSPSIPELSGIVDQIYAAHPVDLMMVETTAVDLTNAEWYPYQTGLNEEQITKVDAAVTSEPGVGSQAYCMVLVRLKDKANGDEIAEAMLDGIDMHKWVCVAADKASVATFDDKVLFVMADSELVDVDALMTDAANALGVTFGYNMSKESAEDYGELPDELLATPAVVG